MIIPQTKKIKIDWQQVCKTLLELKKIVRRLHSKLKTISKYDKFIFGKKKSLHFGKFFGLKNTGNSQNGIIKKNTIDDIVHNLCNIIKWGYLFCFILINWGCFMSPTVLNFFFLQEPI